MHYCLEGILKFDNGFQEMGSVILLWECMIVMGGTMIFSDLKKWHTYHLVWKHGFFFFFFFGKQNENMPRAYGKQGWECTSNKSKASKIKQKAQTLLEIQSRQHWGKQFLPTRWSQQWMTNRCDLVGGYQVSHINLGI